MEDRNPRAMASQETLASMQQIDPSPVDSPYYEDEKPFPDPDSASPPAQGALPRSSTLGLSGGGHGAVYYLTRLQRYSSYVFAAYTTAHITNTSLLPLLTRSVPVSENYLLLTRPYYQSFPFEHLLITLPLATHILSGLALRIRRRNQNLARYGGGNLPIATRLQQRWRVWPPVSWESASGYMLVPLVGSHIFVNRLIPWWYEGGSSSVGLEFVSHGFAKHPFVAWTGYLALLGVGTGHIVWGAARWLGLTPVGKDKKAKRRWWAVNGAWAVTAAVWMMGGLGVVGRGGKAEGWIAKGFDELYAKVPFVDL
ncbi:hypothetical protein BP6252_11681 [Coleophoma cylindrospora]|uniref:Mitochondrial adapter protein MCP1 transmembrane domain-containing protein n=1 Tax=Coleophoma cylindrospora TaxID=1849047 RepID=A0A3D8QKJ8_9HELO|nr:hypothetical protein BP6252_11681 [Coleophoma cylindrospora]